MDVVPDGTTTVGLLASQSRPQSRTGAIRNRPLSNGLACLARATSISATEMRVTLGADATSAAITSPTGMSTTEPAVARSAFVDCLSSIGLPGEEEATFEPLLIEPYEPSLSASIADATITATAACAGSEPPPSPLTPPTATPSPSTSQPSPTATAAAAISIQPKPPPGSALKRFTPSRRSLVRQTSQASTAAATTAAGAASGGGGGGAADSAAGGNGGGGAGSEGGAGASGFLPAAPRTPNPAATGPAPVPPSPALALGEVPVVVFDPTAIPVLPGAAAASAAVGGGVADGKATSSFLDPSKPAVRRLLPPLLRASQALQDNASADVPLAALEESNLAGCSSPLPPSRGGSGIANGGSSLASPAGGAGGPDGWAELTEALSASTPTPPAEPLSVPLLCVDVYDTASPRGRRALPPMDTTRTLAAVAAASLSAASTTSEAEPSAELPVLSPEPLPYSVLTVGYADAAATASRRGPPHRARPGGAGEADECLTAGGDCLGATGDGYVSLVSGGHGGVLHRTVSLHATGSSSGSGAGGAGGSSGGYVGGGQMLDVQRLRARSAVLQPDLSVLAVSVSSYMANGGGGGGGNSSSGGVAGTGRESGRLSRTSSLSFGSARAAAVTSLAATTTVTAALPPIQDRAGSDRRQTMTN